MKQTLLNERQERYISEYEYRERAAKLEQELRLLTAGAELDTAKQVAGQPETEHRREPGSLLPRPTPEPVVRPTPLPSDSFRYSIQDGQATVTGYRAVPERWLSRRKLAAVRSWQSGTEPSGVRALRR